MSQMRAESNAESIPKPRGGALDEASTNTALRLSGLLLFPILTGLFAQPQLAVPLPPDGVPMTFQTLAVLMCAIVMGPRLGPLSMVIYLAAGAIGAPIFADSGAGVLVLIGQTGGFLLGFVLCQPVVGWIVRRRDGSIRGWGAMVLAILAADLVIFGVGVPWLAVTRGFSLERALAGGFYPFIPGMVVKSVLAVIVGRIAAPHAARRIW